MDTPPSQEPLFPEPQGQPLPPVEPPAPPSPARARDPRRFITPALAALAMVLTVVGCFLPLFRGEQSLGSDNSPAGFLGSRGLVVTLTTWKSEINFPGERVVSQAAPPVGFPLIFAAAVLSAATIAGAWYAFTRSGGVLTKWLTSCAAVFLAGVVATVAMQGVGWSSTTAALGVTTSMQTGMWLLIAATVAALAAAVVAQLSRAETEPTDDHGAALADLTTPRQGFSITVLPPESPPSSPFAPPPGEHG